MTQADNQSNPQAVDDAVFGSDGDAFFDALEDGVNGAIQESSPEVKEGSEATRPNNSGTEQATHATQDGPNIDSNWEKRYKDSTREAQRMHKELGELKPFVPVLEAMKNDTGLVDHVKDYLVSGGKPAKSVTENLGLGDDFIFDGTEAVKDPESDSAKVMNAHVDRVVEKRVGEILTTENKKATVSANKQKTIADLERFRQAKGMSNEEFGTFIDKAKGHRMTLEDLHFLLNKDSVSKNTAKSTKKAMLTQMKNVRSIPASASGTNSQGQQGSVEDDVFDKIVGIDNDLDNLFG
jgi:hypothetical protein